MLVEIIVNDLVVLRYWELKRKTLEREKNDMYRPGCTTKELDEMIRKRRGLLGSAEGAYRYGFKFIAAGLIDEGLEHARWAVRFGSLAQKVGDLGIYEDNNTGSSLRRPSHEIGLARLHESLYWGKWLLGDRTAEAELELSLQNTMVYWEAAPPAVPVTDPYDQSLCLWGSVVPFLRVGWVEDAARWVRLVIGPEPMSLRQAARSATHLDRKPAIQLGSNALVLRSYLQTMLGWLNEDRISEESARMASDKFHYDISRWGHNQRTVQGRTWRQFLIDEHVELAQIRARYFTHETDPIAIVQSIRGVPI
jgi:hypothetical protein